MKPGERIHFPAYDSHPTHSCLWERRQQVPSSAILSPLSVTHERRRIQGVLIITGSSSQTTSPLPPLLPMTTYHKNILYYRYHDRKKMKKKTLAFSNPPPRNDKANGKLCVTCIGKEKPPRVLFALGEAKEVHPPSPPRRLEQNESGVSATCSSS